MDRPNLPLLVAGAVVRFLRDVSIVAAVLLAFIFGIPWIVEVLR